EFKNVSEKKACRPCGQPLTEKHFAEEKKKREHEAKAADAKLKSRADAATKARDVEEKLNEKEAQAREHPGKLRDQYKGAAAGVKQAALDIKRLTDSCQKSYY